LLMMAGGSERFSVPDLRYLSLLGQGIAEMC